MVYKVKNRFFSSNTYLITKEGATNCIIIDPGLDYESIDEYITLNFLSPIAILCTHGHFDHIASVHYFKKKYKNIPYYLHKLDFKIAKSANFFLKLAKIDHWIEYVEPDYLFTNEHEELKINEFQLEIVNLPGHSYGSCIIQFENSLFTGDLIYKKGLGFNNFPGENKVILKKSIKYLLETYDGETIVYPGHGDSEKLKTILEQNLELINFINV